MVVTRTTLALLLSGTVAFAQAQPLPPAANAQTGQPAAPAPMQQKPEDAMAKAKAAFQAGEAAYNLGHFDEALQKYEEAYRISRLAPILFNLAQANRRIYEEKGDLENLRRARELYRSYLREVPLSSQTKVVQDLLKEADQKYTTELDRKKESLLGAATGKQALNLAKEFLERNDYKSSHYALERFVNTPRNERADVVTGHIIQAHLDMAEDKKESAVDALCRAMVLDASVTAPPDARPALASAYAAAKQRVRDLDILRVRLVPRTDVDPGQAVTVRVEVENDPLKDIRSFVLSLRPAGTQAYAALNPSTDPANKVPTTVSQGLKPGDKLEYYVEVLGEHEAVLASLGTADAPYVLVVREPSPPWYKRWWVWGIVGAAAVGTTAAIIATRDGPFQAGPAVTIPPP